MDRAGFQEIEETVRKLLGKAEDAFINPLFSCDYGTHFEEDENFFANRNCTVREKNSRRPAL